MTDEETIQKLLDLKLATMAQAFRDLLAEPPGNQRSFTEKIAHMVDREWADRDNRRLARLLRAAHLTINDASLENVWCEVGRGLDKAVVRDLATCQWVRNKHNVIVVGKTGGGSRISGPRWRKPPAARVCAPGARVSRASLTNSPSHAPTVRTRRSSHVSPGSTSSSSTTS